MLGWILLALFLAAQIMAFVFVWVLRYHLRLFSLPGDRRASQIVFVFTVGTILLALASGFSLIPLIR